MKITAVINEEIKKVLNESYIMNDNKFKFKQNLNNSTFTNYENFTTEFDSKVLQSNIVVTWGISFWLNQNGIENFIIDVEKVEGIFQIELRDKHSDELKQNTEKNINEFEWKFIVTENTSLIKGGSLYVSSLDFDFKNKTCVVKF